MGVRKRAGADTRFSWAIMCGPWQRQFVTNAAVNGSPNGARWKSFSSRIGSGPYDMHGQRLEWVEDNLARELRLAAPDRRISLGAGRARPPASVRPRRFRAQRDELSVRPSALKAPFRVPFRHACFLRVARTLTLDLSNFLTTGVPSNRDFFNGCRAEKPESTCARLWPKFHPPGIRAQMPKNEYALAFQSGDGHGQAAAGGDPCAPSGSPLHRERLAADRLVEIV